MPIVTPIPKMSVGLGWGLSWSGFSNKSESDTSVWLNKELLVRKKFSLCFFILQDFKSSNSCSKLLCVHYKNSSTQAAGLLCVLFNLPKATLQCWEPKLDCIAVLVLLAHFSCLYTQQIFLPSCLPTHEKLHPKSCIYTHSLSGTTELHS